MSYNFNLARFEEKISAVEGIEPRDLERFEQIIEIFEFILKNDNVTSNQLESFELEPMEWLLDALLNAPADGDYLGNKQGNSIYEYFRSYDLIHRLKILKPEKKPTAFI